MPHQLLIPPATTIPITASVTAAGSDSISSVSFYDQLGATPSQTGGDTLLGTVSTPSGGSYTFNLTPSTNTPTVAAGNHTIYAIASSSAGITSAASSTVALTVTIPTIAFTTSNPFYNESAGTVSVTVTRSATGDTTDSVTVPYTIGGAGSTATLNTDYTVAGNNSQPLTFSGGTTSQTISINLLNSPSQIGDKTVLFTLGTPSPAATVVSGSSVSTITILQNARAFTPGDFVVDRFGTGQTALTNAATIVYLDEYNTSGTLVQSFELPTSASGGNLPLTVDSTSTSEGALSLSADGRSLLLAGFDAVPGVASVVSLTAANEPRVVGIVSPNGSVNSSNAYNDWASAGDPRSAVLTPDGAHLYLAGSSGGVRYANVSGGVTSTTSIASTPSTIRQVEIAGGKLYYSANSTGSGVYTFATSLPTTTGNAGSAVITDNSPYGFFFASDSSPNDTLYVVDDTTTVGLEKYSFSGGVWVSNGIASIPTGGSGSGSIRGLTGVRTVSGITLFVSALGNTANPGGYIYSLNDTTTFNTAIASGTKLTTLVSSTNPDVTFRGLSLVPVGAPTITNSPLGSGPPAGGTTITITGTNFTPDSTVLFGTTAASSVTYVSPTSLTVVTPAGGAGTTAVVTVTAQGGAAIGSFTYTGTAFPTYFSPDSASSVTISGENVTVNGTATIVADPNDTALKITVTGGTLNFNVSGGTAIHIGSLALNNTTTASFAGSPSGTAILMTSALVFAGTGTLNLANDYMDVIGGTVHGVFTEIGQGFSNGLWTGSGITSSTAKNNSTHLTALGVLLDHNVTSNSVTTLLISSFDGQAVAAGDVLVRYTYYGDATLDGQVNADDYSRIDSAFLAGSGSTGWFNGDFNYDGVLNGSDYTLIDNAFNTQGAANPSAVVASAVPSTRIKSTYVATVPVTTTSDSTFSEKKVKQSLVELVMQDLVTN